MKKLYQHIINEFRSVTNKFDDSITVQRYEENLPNQVGIILSGSRADEECISGEVEWEAMELEIQITCENNANEIFENIDIVRQFVDKFENEPSTVDGLEIIWAKHLGAKCRPAYTNGYGLEVIKCVIDINYRLEED